MPLIAVKLQENIALQFLEVQQVAILMGDTKERVLHNALRDPYVKPYKDIYGK